MTENYHERRCVKRTISMPSRLAEGAEKQAELEHRTLSNYIQRLIARDLDAQDKPQQEAAA